MFRVHIDSVKLVEFLFLTLLLLLVHNVVVSPQIDVVGSVTINWSIGAFSGPIHACTMVVVYH